MSASTAGAKAEIKTWDAADGPIAIEAVRRFETAWRDRLSPKTIDFLAEVDADQRQGVLLALLRRDELAF